MSEAGFPDVSMLTLLAALLLPCNCAKYGKEDVNFSMLVLQGRKMRSVQTSWNGHVPSQILEVKAYMLS